MILIKANFSSGSKYVAKTNCSFHPIDGSVLSISNDIEFTENSDLAIDFVDSRRADNWISHFHSNQDFMDENKISFFDLAWKN